MPFSKRDTDGNGFWWGNRKNWHKPAHIIITHFPDSAFFFLYSCIPGISQWDNQGNICCDKLKLEGHESFTNSSVMRQLGLSLRHWAINSFWPDQNPFFPNPVANTMWQWLFWHLLWAHKNIHTYWRCVCWERMNRQFEGFFDVFEEDKCPQSYFCEPHCVRCGGSAHATLFFTGRCDL